MCTQAIHIVQPGVAKNKTQTMLPLLLDFHKETEAKLHWAGMVDGTLFELPIFKWRVPDPRPFKTYMDFIPIPAAIPCMPG